MLRAFITAFRTLTAIPIPGSETSDKAASLPWFAVVGCFIGIIVWLVAQAIMWLTTGGWPGGAAIVAVLTSVLVTGGLHLDGLADWADAFGGAWDKEKTLSVMKDPHVGPFGILSLVLAVALQGVAIYRLLLLGLAQWIIPAFIISRSIMADLAAAHPYARDEAGTASPFVRGAHRIHRVAPILLAFILVAPAFGPAGTIAILVGYSCAFLFGRSCARRIGGVTGDILGAACVITETSILFLFALGGDRMNAWSSWTWPV